MDFDTINDDKTIVGGGGGAMFAGRYRIVRQLGQGGMGSVWLAEDTQLDNKPFAIKMLPSILVSNKRAYRQLKGEALVAMKLTHPNIVTLRAFEENNGNPFLVMDYIDGETLDDYLAEYGGSNLTQRRGEAESQSGVKDGFGYGLPEEEVIRVLRPIAAALDYAHGEGVVHRDVKPANVMIRKDGHPFILDFGIAREIQETMTRVTGKLSSGTLLYMSPEQLNGEMPTPAQDVYSFAAMAYECLKGEPPFVRGAIEDQIKNKVPEPLNTTSSSPKIGEVAGGQRGMTIAASVMAGLVKKPEDRPKSCVAVLAGGGFSRVERAERVEGGTGSTKLSPIGHGTPRDSTVGEEDAARARVEAKMRKRRLEQLSDEDGFGERKASLGELFVKAEMFFESRLWGDAMRCFLDCAKQCDDLEKLDLERTERKRKEAEDRAENERERKRREAEAKAAEELMLGPPSGTVKTIVLPGGVEMCLRWCRPGSFMMGSPESEKRRSCDERQHEVTLTRGFWLGETPVTQRQWQSVMRSNPSHFNGADLPVESVSWEDCQRFLQKVNGQLDCGARLPTEAEWEYACRAGTGGAYGGTGSLDEMGWFYNTLFGIGLKTHPVAQKKPNAWGLYDMHGNVWEWCQDWYGEYPSESVIDPQGPSSGGPSSGVDHVNRGGSWRTDARYCRSAYRAWDSPDIRNDNLGFRVALAPCH